MKTAKIIRHRHRWEYQMNGITKSVEERDDFKIVFSDPVDMAAFEKWCKGNKGEYEFVKADNTTKGKLPELEIFTAYTEGLCWCDIMQYYLLHAAGYIFHSALSPYTGELYTKG